MHGWGHPEAERELKLRARPQAGGEAAAGLGGTGHCASGHEHGSARDACTGVHSADPPESYDITWGICKCRNKGIQ